MYRGARFSTNKLLHYSTRNAAPRPFPGFNRHSLVVVKSSPLLLAMSAQYASAQPKAVNLDSSAVSSPSLWNRVSNWVSEHKTVVYTVAGVAVVVTGAGLVYYLRDSSQDQDSINRRASKKERRKAKKEKEAAEKTVKGKALAIGQ